MNSYLLKKPSTIENAWYWLFSADIYIFKIVRGV